MRTYNLTLLSSGISADIAPTSAFLALTNSSSLVVFKCLNFTIDEFTATTLASFSVPITTGGELKIQGTGIASFKYVNPTTMQYYEDWSQNTPTSGVIIIPPTGLSANLRSPRPIRTTPTDQGSSNAGRPANSENRDFVHLPPRGPFARLMHPLGVWMSVDPADLRGSLPPRM